MLGWATGSRPRELWAQAVAEAIGRIAGGELDKVVLARDIVAELDGPLDSPGLLSRMAETFPACWTFSVDGLAGRHSRAAGAPVRRPGHLAGAGRDGAAAWGRLRGRRPRRGAPRFGQGPRGARVRGPLGGRVAGRALHRPRRARSRRTC